MRWVNEGERTICYRKEQIEVSFSFGCLVIDNEFRHSIVKAVCKSTRLRIVSWIQNFFDDVITKFIINNKTYE